MQRRQAVKICTKGSGVPRREYPVVWLRPIDLASNTYLNSSTPCITRFEIFYTEYEQEFFMQNLNYQLKVTVGSER